MKPWLLSSEQVCQELKTSATKGLSSDAVARKQKEYGLNKLIQAVSVSAWSLLVGQFLNVIVGILVVACLIAVLLGTWIDAIAIAVIVFFNAIIGFVQEYGAERSLEALQRLVKPDARVIRNGKELEISATDIVPGDIVLLEAGDVVPADGRVLKSHELTADESALTGESAPVTKIDTPLQEAHYDVIDLRNMAFTGTIVVKGRGRLVVTHTGSFTRLGQVAEYITQTQKEVSPLHKQLKQVGYVLIAVSVIIASAVVLVGLSQGVPLLALLFTSLSLFVAAVPEGLPAVITIALARAVKRMAKKNALIRRLASVEALGGISIICTDKTGTITQNRMAVSTIYVDNTEFEVTGTGIGPEGLILKNGLAIDLKDEPDLYQALEIAVLCNGAEIAKKDTEWSLKGDPTEGALLTVALKVGLTKSDLEESYPLIKEYPFDSRRKRMSMLRRTSSGARLYVKGATDSLLECSTRYLKQGKIYDLTQEERNHLQVMQAEYGKRALRVLAVAFKDGDELSFDGTNKDESDLIFVGFIAMIDPPRPEVKEALHRASHAGIRTIMLTGDHQETARAIGLSVGLMNAQDKVLTGKDIDHLSDEGLLQALYAVPIFARISVDHKIRIVTLLTKAGERVAMTGDGINDAPALKKADIGIAMGITGTDVAKEAADMIITDDNYASIVSAIKEGRGMYETLMKFVQYLLSSNLAELLVVLWGVLYGFIGGVSLVALRPIHLLWINLISDGLPAIALVFDPMHKGLMRKKPDDFRVSLVSPERLRYFLGVGIILSLGVLAAYIYGLTISVKTGQTMAFTTLVLLEFVRLASVRAEYHLSFFSNPLVILAMVISLLLQLLLLYVPFLQEIFQTVPLSGYLWLVIFIISFITWLVYKLLHRRMA